MSGDLWVGLHHHQWCASAPDPKGHFLSHLYVQCNSATFGIRVWHVWHVLNLHSIDAMRVEVSQLKGVTRPASTR